MTDEAKIPLNDWVVAGWNDHGDDAEGVMARFPEAMDLVSEPDHLPPLATLIVHVAGNHLGRYADGLDLLGRLVEHEVFDASSAAGQSVIRCQAILHLCAGDEAAASEHEERGHPEGDLPRESTAVRVRAIAAGALGENGTLDRAIPLFEETLEFAAYGPTKEDPAAQALAITSNNLACELEVRPDRTEAEDRLLELAAKTARTFWEIAGTWVQVKIAEYRLAMTYIALGDAETATAHARESLALCDANDGGEQDRFFPYEALARARHAAGDAEGATAARDHAARALEASGDEVKEWFTSALEELDAAIS